MPQKLDRQILGLIETTPIPAPTRVDRIGLKRTADLVIDELGLNKGDHSAIVGAMINLYEHGKVSSSEGSLVLVTDEVRTTQGRRRSGIRKQHARGSRPARIQWTPLEPVVA